MLTITETSRFKRDVRKIKKQGKELAKLAAIVRQLQIQNSLPAQNKDHPLTGNWRGYQECHIEPDWLLIYQIDLSRNILVLVRTGSHSDLF